MAKPRAILKRRQAVQNIGKITKTMQMIATAKFKRAHDRAVAARPYTDRLTALIADLAAAAGSFEHPLLQSRPPRRVALLALASNRGLCGGYNAGVFRTLVGFRKQLLAQDIEAEVHVVGKRLRSLLAFTGVLPASFHTRFEDRPAFEEVDALTTTLVERTLSGDLDALHVCYMKFESASRQRPVVETVLPLAPPTSHGTPPHFIYHPDAATILADLLPRRVRLHVFQAFLDAAVSEQAARMVAMKAATDNAMEMIRDLTRLYNRSRQTQITTELSEIIGGSSALA